MTQPVRRPPILVAGCLRSGFAYITRVLTVCGLDIAHENTAGRDGVVAWWVGHRYQDEVTTRYPGAIVLHQVRHPLHAIASMRPRMGKNYHKQFVPQSATPLHRAALLWFHLNNYAENVLMPDATYRIEQLWTIFPHWCAHAHIPYSTRLERQCRRISPTVNASRHPDLSWEEVRAHIPEHLFQGIVDTMARYGYRETICVS